MQVQQAFRDSPLLRRTASRFKERSHFDPDFERYEVLARLHEDDWLMIPAHKLTKLEKGSGLKIANQWVLMDPSNFSDDIAVEPDRVGLVNVRNNSIRLYLRRQDVFLHPAMNPQLRAWRWSDF